MQETFRIYADDTLRILVCTQSERFDFIKAFDDAIAPTRWVHSIVGKWAARRASAEHWLGIMANDGTQAFALQCLSNSVSLQSLERLVAWTAELVSSRSCGFWRKSVYKHNTRMHENGTACHLMDCLAQEGWNGTAQSRMEFAPSLLAFLRASCVSLLLLLPYSVRCHSR